MQIVVLLEQTGVKIRVNQGRVHQYSLLPVDIRSEPGNPILG